MPRAERRLRAPILSLPSNDRHSNLEDEFSSNTSRQSISVHMHSRPTHRCARLLPRSARAALWIERDPESRCWCQLLENIQKTRTVSLEFQLWSELLLSSGGWVRGFSQVACSLPCVD